jgi:amino acid adenylation domain-containing protein
MFATTTVLPGKNSDALAARPAARYPLSALQEGMLFHYLMAPGAGVDIEQFHFAIASALDVDRLRAAWELVSDRYDVLRTSFRWDTERPLQEVWPHAPVPWDVEDRSTLPVGERERYRDACGEAERSALTLTRAPVQRVRVIRWSATSFTLIWTYHHAILDGRARAIVTRDIVDAYAGRTLAPVGVQFGAQVAWLEANDVAASEGFWREYLHGIAAPTPLPASSGGTPAPTGHPRPHVVTRTFDAADTAPLLAFAKSTGLSVNVFLNAAWGLLLSRHASTSDVLFGAVRACRHSGVAGSNGIVGLLINTLPLRVPVDENAGVVAWLQQVRAQWDAHRDVEHTPLRAAAAWSEITPPSPLFESLLVYERDTFEKTVQTTIDPEGVLGIDSVRLIDQTDFPLTLAVFGTSDLTFRMAANSRRFNRDDAARILDQFLTVLRSLPGHAADQVRDISLLAPGEARRIAAFNRTTDYPRDATVPELFAKQVARRPDATAVQLGMEALTYAELAARADAIAARLAELGIGRGDYVGVCVERSFEMVAALLGVLQAGGASIALDATHPAARIAFMLRDAGARVVLAQTHLRAALTPALSELGAQAPAVVALEGLTPVKAPSARVALAAEDAAHVMYTSGSTGPPKGAVLPHRAVVRTVCVTDYLRFAAEETFFAFVPLTFDVSILELWGPLLNGARLVLCPPGLPSLDELGTVIETQGVTTLWLTTALFEQMIDEQLPRLRGLHQLIVGGDVMSPSHARRVIAAVPGIRMLNVYGPTEATVLITAHHLCAPPNGPIPLGRPIPNATVYVLDALRRPVPVGVPGEIYTGGDGVALGYLNRPELSADRFVPDPFIGRDGATMYRTGDLGRWNAGGELEFLGRVDTQVKIRGMRVELGEIESMLTEHPTVREAVVIAAPGPSLGKTLLAYVVPRDGDPPRAGDLQAFLGRRLPGHMVPSFVVFLNALPRTSTGKFDRLALPDAGPLLQSAAKVDRQSPASDAEITVAGYVAEILGIDDIGRDDDFYALGCDSLRAMRLVSRLREAFHVNLTIRELVAAPTVGGLTAAIVARTREPARESGSNVAALSTTGTKPPLFFLHGDLTGGGYYCRELARRLAGNRPFYVVGPHGVGEQAMPLSIEAMARENIRAIRAVHPAGPLVLGGFCNGGVVAYEMARQLVLAGVRVDDVVLVDTFCHSAIRKPLTVRIRAEVRWLLERCGLLAPVHVRPATSDAANWEEWHERLLARWLQLLGRYVPRAYDGNVSLMWSDASASQAERLTAEWRRVARRAAVAGRIPGSHLTAITRYVAETSRTLAVHLS